MRTINYGRGQLSLRDAQQMAPPGWAGLITELFLLSSEEDADVHQIKEKYGGLRWYCGGSSEYLDKVEAICERSYSICEECGALGKPRDGGWVRTLCDTCADAR